MEYEAYEPDPNDPYYDQIISATYAFMFSEGRSVDAFQNPDNYECLPADC